MTNYIKVAGLFPSSDYAHAAIVEAGDRLVFTAGGGQLVEITAVAVVKPAKST